MKSRNWDAIARDWKHFKDKVKEHWGNLDDHNPRSIGGKYEREQSSHKQPTGSAATP